VLLPKYQPQNFFDFQTCGMFLRVTLLGQKVSSNSKCLEH
jgi:hypothetical protein